MSEPLPRFADRDILAARPERNRLDPRRPYAFLTEPECNARGEVVDVATLFLSNRECPFRCLMCDLWKNTFEHSVTADDIVEQVGWGLAQLPPAREVKLYNSGNFFDRQAIPRDAWEPIANLVRTFDTVIVENHPKLCDASCREFRDLIAPATLEIAIGLETCHPEMLATLNKRMTLDDFDAAADELHTAGIRTRAFLLHGLPFLDESEITEWTGRSIEYAFKRGVDCCSVIPTRVGNGMMERLAEEAHFTPPNGASLEDVFQRGLAIGPGRVFVDLWDAAQFFPCNHCRDRRLARLRQMNLRQIVLPPVTCLRCRP